MAHTSFELPEFTEVLYTPWDFQKAAESGRSTFIRAIRIEFPHTVTNLESLLNAAEVHLSLLDEVGLTSVPHTWGIVKEDLIPAHHRWEYQDHGRNILPVGFCFAAEVATVAAQEEPLSLRRAFIQKHAAYNEKIRQADEPLRFYDLKPDSVLYGELSTGAVDAEPRTRHWLTDIEPRFMSVHN